MRKITFTGSRDVGEEICRQAGLKKVTMELGSNAPLIIMPDADLDKVCQAVVDNWLQQRRTGLHQRPACVGTEADLRRIDRETDAQSAGDSLWESPG